MAFLKINELDIAGKRVLIRSDLNVPVKNGVVTSDARINASLPTIKFCLDAGAKVLVMSHRGRPKEGVVDNENSMQPIADNLSEKLGFKVPLETNYFDKNLSLDNGQIVLLENVRFNSGEKSNDLFEVVYENLKVFENLSKSTL